VTGKPCKKWTCDHCGETDLVEGYYEDSPTSLDPPGWVWPMPHGWKHREFVGKCFDLCEACDLQLIQFVHTFVG
jgi:hypothetical protein